ncbi:MAG: manganese-dependent inorganic pyrophosphatase [Clostridia bacterium]|nr:manganese-dependent inorganic pyrophosphatase [Clostridia bacterium]
MEKILIFGHKNPDTDSICSAMVHEILDRKNGRMDTKAVRLGNVNKETKFVLDYLKVEAPELIEKVEEGQKVLLVDHNEFSQSAEGIEKAKILGVTDHHKIANFETSEPLYYTAKPYGCTATILFEDFKRLGHEIEKKEAILMLSAIISDTLLLKSPTTTEYDKKALEELAKIANIDVQEYGLEMLKAGTDLSEFTAEELINIDSKNTTSKDVNIQVAQINTASIEDVLKNQTEIEDAMKKFIETNNINIFMFLITDIINSNSEAIVLGNRVDIAEKAFGKKTDDNRMFLQGVVSRKKQVFPVLIENA